MKRRCVIEDEQAMRDVLREFLTDEGADATMAATTGTASHARQRITSRTAPGANAAVALPLPRYPVVNWLMILTLVTLIITSPLIFDLAVQLGMAR